MTTTATTQTITLGTQSFTVEVTEHTTWLTGTRGGVYFLRSFLGEDNGLRQVISWKSGQPLRVRGNEVRVYALGDIIEVA